MAIPLTWTERFPAHHPSFRYLLGMAYDAARGETVLYGGYDGSVLEDTWTWDGTDWTQKSPANHPGPRNGIRLVYDAVREEVVLFGGGSAVDPYLDETWVWDGTDWTQRTPANSPSGRNEYEVAWDDANGKVVLFGGGGLGSPPFDGDTWTWDGTDWTQETPATSPTARANAAMAWDSRSGNVVLYGGLSYSGGFVYDGDTWTWNGANWTQQTVASPPGQRYNHRIVDDLDLGLDIVFGGQDETNTRQGDTRGWDGADWELFLIPPSLPPIRESFGFAYDAARGETVLFGGGHSTSPFFASDTWVLGRTPGDQILHLEGSG